MAEIKRQTAYKVRISDLMGSTYVVQEGWDANYFVIEGKRVSRVNIIGTVVFLNPEDGSTMLDDGSGTILVRSFENAKMLSGLSIGDIAVIVGKPKEYGNEKYINAELARKTDYSWLSFRKKELEALSGLDIGEGAEEGAEKEKEVIAKESIEDEEIKVDYPLTTPQRIINAIKSLDAGDGVEIEEIVRKVGKCEETIEAMIRRGDIFENRRGRVKIL